MQKKDILKNGKARLNKGLSRLKNAFQKTGASKPKSAAASSQPKTKTNILKGVTVAVRKTLKLGLLSGAAVLGFVGANQLARPLFQPAQQEKETTVSIVPPANTPVFAPRAISAYTPSTCPIGEAPMTAVSVENASATDRYVRTLANGTRVLVVDRDDISRRLDYALAKAGINSEFFPSEKKLATGIYSVLFKRVVQDYVHEKTGSYPTVQDINVISAALVSITSPVMMKATNIQGLTFVVGANADSAELFDGANFGARAMMTLRHTWGAFSKERRLMALNHEIGHAVAPPGFDAEHAATAVLGQRAASVHLAEAYGDVYGLLQHLRQGGDPAFVQHWREQRLLYNSLLTGGKKSLDMLTPNVEAFARRDNGVLNMMAAGYYNTVPIIDGMVAQLARPGEMDRLRVMDEAAVAKYAAQITGQNALDEWGIIGGYLGSMLYDRTDAEFREAVTALAVMVTSTDSDVNKIKDHAFRTASSIRMALRAATPDDLLTTHATLQAAEISEDDFREKTTTLTETFSSLYNVQSCFDFEQDVTERREKLRERLDAASGMETKIRIQDELRVLDIAAMRHRFAISRQPAPMRDDIPVIVTETAAAGRSPATVRRGT